MFTRDAIVLALIAAVYSANGATVGFLDTYASNCSGTKTSIPLQVDGVCAVTGTTSSKFNCASSTVSNFNNKACNGTASSTLAFACSNTTLSGGSCAAVVDANILNLAVGTTSCNAAKTEVTDPVATLVVVVGNCVTLSGSSSFKSAAPVGNNATITVYNNANCAAPGTATTVALGVCGEVVVPAAPTVPAPSNAPSRTPSKAPTLPTKSPSTAPSKSPTVKPSNAPTVKPSTAPSKSPVPAAGRRVLQSEGKVFIKLSKFSAAENLNLSSMISFVVAIVAMSMVFA